MPWTKMLLMLSIAMIAHGIEGCSKKPEESGSMKPQLFGHTTDGKEVFLYTLKNRSGIEARIMNYGGIVVSLRVPDGTNTLDDIVLGYDTLADYLKESPYFGALIGRYGNRIKEGKFTLNGQEYALATNNGRNHLHGGVRGFDKVVWDAHEVQTKEGPYSS